MKMSAQDQLELGVVDRVVPEPGEGAHADPRETARRLRAVIISELDRLSELTQDELVEARYRRYRALGPYTEVATPAVAPPPSRGLADRLRDLLDPTRWSMGTPPPVTSRRDEPPAHEEV
jgi:enoyl-CoA hydratase/carnithine racemase